MPHDGGMSGLRLHPRTMHVHRAEADLRNWLIRFQDERDLTDAEMTVMLAECARRSAVLVLRAERHPDDPDRKADEL